MRRVLMCLTVLVFIFSGANAGILKEKVDFADLSQLSPEALEALKESEFKVFLTKVKHAGTKVLEGKAGEDLRASRLTLDAKKWHLGTAKVDLKEAEKTQDQARIKPAEQALRNAQGDFEFAKLLVKWKEKELDAKIAGVERAKGSVLMAEAERDLARVSKLAEQNAPSAAKYTLSDFEDRLEKRKKEYEKAVSRERREILETETLKEGYEKLTKQ